MYPKGIIYKRGFPIHGEIFLHASLKIRILYSLFRGLGAGLIGFAIIAVLLTYGPVIKEEINYRINSLKTVQNIPKDDLVKQIKAQKIDEVQGETTTMGIIPFFSLNTP